MALVETLVWTVGPAIAKGILATWLGDAEVTKAVAGSLLDLLAVKTQDRVAQWYGARHFEQIGVKVAESLLPLFEGVRLEESSCEAVAWQVAQTLNETPLDAELLAQRHLEPSKVAKYLLEARPEAMRDFSRAEEALYRRVMTELASAMVDIASQLPNFSERTFGEVLKRQDKLLAVVEGVLAEMRHIREQSQRANPEQAAAIFEERYRSAIVRQLDEVELFGVDLPRASRRHPLSVAYVTLSVTQTVSLGRHPMMFLRTLNNVDEPIERRVTLAVDEALARSRRWLILGAAGSGKTTLLKWMAVRSALGEFKEQLSHWNGYIPFFIRLRQFTQGKWPTPEEFPRLVAPAIAGEMPASWVHEQTKAYFKQVLCNLSYVYLNPRSMPFLEKLQFLLPPDLSSTAPLDLITFKPLAQLPNLSWLHISSLPTLNNLTELSYLPNLSTLILSYLPSLNDLTPLACLPNLSFLYLEELFVLNDLTPLTHLSNLSRLILSELPTLNDLTGMPDLANLSELHLLNWSSLNDLTGMSNFPNLSLLFLWHLPAIHDLTPLTKLWNLSELILWNLPAIHDLSPLVEVTNLRKIALYDMRKNLQIPPELAKRVEIVWK